MLSRRDRAFTSALPVTDPGVPIHGASARVEFNDEVCAAAPQPGRASERKVSPLSYDVVSVYTLTMGDEYGPATVSVHATAEEAWRALDREVRARCGLRPRPRRAVNPDATSRLADAWRAGDGEARFWQIRPHQLSVMVPTFSRPLVPAQH